MWQSLTQFRQVTIAVPHCPKCGGARYRVARGPFGPLGRSLICRDCGEDIVAAYREQREGPRFFPLFVALGLVGVVAAFGLVAVSMQAHAP